jgi:hypothetical protein
MKSPLRWIFDICFATSILVSWAAGEVVYTNVNVSIPVGDSYNIDLNGDGITDFNLRSRLLQGYCQWGDEYVWTLTVTPASGNTVITEATYFGDSYPIALHIGIPVNSSQSFSPSASIMAGLYWGPCGHGTLGQWLTLPNRYLGLQVQDATGAIHYGWAKVSTVAYVDQSGNLHASTILSNFAYETVPYQEILTGQMSDAS